MSVSLEKPNISPNCRRSEKQLVIHYSPHTILLLLTSLSSDLVFTKVHTFGSKTFSPNTTAYATPTSARPSRKSPPPDGGSFGADSRARKRPKLDTSISSTIAVNGASPSCARGPAPRSSVSDPGIQVMELPRMTVDRSIPVPNDVGERVSPVANSPSPDPMLLSLQRTGHAIETHPTEYSSSASNKRKGRAKELSELVESSEEEPTRPPPRRLSNTGRSRGIHTGVVHERKRFHGNGAHASAPVAIHHTIEKEVNVVDLMTRTTISRKPR